MKVTDSEVGVPAPTAHWRFLAAGKHHAVELDLSDFLTSGPEPCEICGYRAVNIARLRSPDGDPVFRPRIVIVCGTHCNARDVLQFLEIPCDLDSL